MNKFERTEMLLGCAAVEKLKKSHVAVFGAGGVGGHAIEALVRSGLGEITVVDMDTVSVTKQGERYWASGTPTYSSTPMPLSTIPSLQALHPTRAS